jgi:hypothetical protein
MSRTMSNVFDEKFLLNFTLGSLPISVADMLLVDYILADKQSCNRCDGDVLEKADRNIGIADSPEATRHQAEVDDDRVLICSQRCRSPIQCEDASHSTEKLGAPGNNFSVLSPILREGFDVSIFDQDQHCDLGTTFNLFGSPDEYGSSRTPIPGNQYTSRSSNRMSLNQSQSGSSSPDHMSVSVDIMDSFDINTFSRLSLDPTDSNRGKKNKKNKDKDTEKGEVVNLIADKHSRTFQKKKSTKMKQTTVTFFYDSDDEINENSDLDLDDQSAATASRELRSNLKSGSNLRLNGRAKQCGYGVRNAVPLALPLALAPSLEMRMKMKNKSSMLARDSTHSSSASCYDSTSLTLHGHLPSTTSTTTTTAATSSTVAPVNPHLQRWMMKVSNNSKLYDRTTGK